MANLSAAAVLFPRSAEEEAMVERSLEHIEAQLLQLLRNVEEVRADQRSLKALLDAELERIKENDERLALLESKAGVVVVLARVVLGLCAFIGVLFGTRIGDWFMRLLGGKP